MPRFAATGRVRFESDRGEVDGRLALRVDPPSRVWLEVRADAVFGLVGERVVAVLPGDGWLLVYEERADRIERIPFAETWLADVAPGATLERLLEVAAARVPWPAASPAPAPRTEGGGLVVDLGPAGAEGRLWVDPGSELLRRLRWETGGEVRLDVEYGPAVRCGDGWLPARVRGRGRGVRVDIRLEDVTPRAGFDSTDFELDGTSERGGG